jgi:uncharacterized membrane protein
MFLRLKNINTNEDIDDVIVYVGIGRDSLAKYIGVGEQLGLELDEGRYIIVLKIDEPLTAGKDYFKKQEIYAGENTSEDAYLFPVGSIRGMVKDAFENVVGGAELRFECTNEIGTELPEETNKFGSFKVDYMPAGPCKIFASIGEAVGFTEVEIQQGNITDAEILLDMTILKAPLSRYSVEGLVALLFAIIVVLLAFKYKDKIIKRLKKGKGAKKETIHEEKKEHAPAHNLQKEKAKSSRADDILATLGKKEKDVAELLLERKDETNQATIRHNTGIPRTSLSRILASLEQKKIVKIRKVGKVVKVSLTDWFLGKE